jgi:hypothetical protein
VLVLILVPVFVYMLWPRRHGTVHLVAIPIWTQDPLAAESLPYAYEDARQLAQVPFVKFHSYAQLQHASGLATLGKQLRDWNLKPKSSLILYLGAHGITDGDQAALVCSDFLRTGSREQGTFPMRQVLDQLAACPAGLKLLILNAGRLDYDPRLGVVANDFPRLVEEELRGLPPQELWVMLPAGPFERPAVDHARHQSVFGHAVAEALQGWADRWPQDKFVTLYELYAYVYEHCSRWYDTDTGATQTPLLMKAGFGIVSCSSDPRGADEHQLVFVDKPPAPPDAAAPADGSGSPADAKPGEPKPAASRPDQSQPAAPKTTAWSPWRRAPWRGAALTAAPPSASEPAPPVAPAAEKADKGGEATAAAKPPAAASPAAAPAAPATPPTAPPAAAEKPDRSRRGLVLQCWELRDRLDDMALQGQPAPIGFAPHVWRELNAWLLYHERRCWAGHSPLTAGDAGSAAAPEKPPAPADLVRPDSDLQDLARLRDDLEQLQAAIQAKRPLPRQPESPDLGSRLAECWNRCLAQHAAAETGPDRESDDPDATAKVRRAAWICHAMVFSAVDYVRWHAKASITTSRPVAVYDPLAQWLDQLANTQQWLDTLAAGASLPTGSDHPLAAALQQRALLDGALRARVVAALRDKQATLTQQTIEDLLATPLLRAADRRQLLDALLTLGSATDQGPLPPGPPALPSGYFVSPDQWQRLRDRLTLEKKLLRLAGLTLTGPEAGDVPAATDSDVSHGQRTEAAARGLRTAYQRLAELVRDPLPLKAYRAMLLLDPRDAAQVPADYQLPLYRVWTKAAAVLNLVGPLQPVPLSLTQPAAVSVTLHATQRPLLDRLVQPVLDAAMARLVEISPEPEATLLPKQDEWYAKRLTWRVRAKLDQAAAGVGETMLTVAVADASGLTTKPKAAEARLILPKPNRLELVALRLKSARYRADAQDALRLELFPNRKTQYQLALVNRSGEARQVRVELHALRLPRTSKAVPGRIDDAVRNEVLDRLSGILSHTQLLAASGPLALPADESQRTPLTFAPPASAADSKPEAKKDEAGAAAKPPPASPPAPPAAADAAAGLLCVITDVAHPDQRWLKWIDLSVIRPHRYVEPKVAYDYGGKRITARLRPADLDDDGTPDLPTGDPLQVVWSDEDKQLPEGAAKKLSGELDSPTAVLDLYAAVAPDNVKRIVRLAVDRYPRALVYEVPCDRDAPPDGVRWGSPVRSRPRIRINSLSAAGYPVVFHYAPYVNFPTGPEKKDNAPPVEHRRVPPNDRVIVPAPTRWLRVDFEMDAPVDSFLDPEDRVDVQLGERVATTLHADRAVSFRVEKLGDRGLIELSSAVTDWSVEIPSENLENEQTRVECTLHLHGPTDNEAKDRVVLVLDADKPVIDKAELLPPDRNVPWPMPGGVTEVPKGATVRVRITAQDFSGLAAAQFALYADDKPAWQKPAAALDIRRAEGAYVFEFSFETKDLEPREYSLEIRVTDLARHESEPLSRALRIVVPPPSKPTLGVIRGQIRFGANRSPVSGALFTASIKGPKIGPREVKLDHAGSFVITNLPADAYTITAEGSFQGRAATGKLEGVAPSPPDRAEPITVVVDRKS